MPRSKVNKSISNTDLNVKSALKANEILEIDKGCIDNLDSDIKQTDPSDLNLILDSDVVETDKWMQLFKDISNEPDDIDYQDNFKTKYSSIIKSLDADTDVDLEVHMNLGSEKKLKYNICPKCNVEGGVCDGTLVCHECGLETVLFDDDNKFSFSSEKDHNVSSDSYISFNIIGPNSYGYQRSFLKTCANYSSLRRNNNRKDMYKYNYQYDGKKIPKNAIKLAIEIFSKIKEKNYVFRGNGKKGILAACLFYACVMNNITKTPQKIASVMEIEERFLSHGDRRLQEFNDAGIISIPTILRPLNDYLDQFFPALNIPDKYKIFVSDIIEMAERKNIHIKNDSKTTTKCIGAIYLLTNRIKELNYISKDTIVKECDISKSTFIRYYNLLIINYLMIKPIFKKHRIPMPISWKTKTPTGV
jgi:transcription initiation factor TFIIIB Brf1 subunit/transcription initiation factor TFIIB